ncbi:aminotransferase class V-fold PLP-dependent enzyme [Demequina sp. NBRC 110057]|uniref:aminotransferase class V-fold PLP-dependent enzyme n=1 Tax=Demequina sp. NBRC 110057 TaxID=1570346 RepID=UPI000A044339|nr:aminotransferase class V-fold PLP-dependent enzyme [Demequina sp. NBRC 110057]
MLSDTLTRGFDAARGYLDTASYGLPARATAAALHASIDAWSTGRFDPREADAAVGRCRRAFATLVGASAQDIALASATSAMVGTVAASLPVGARVLVADGDFGSLVRPFVADPRLTVESVPLDRLIDAVRPGIDLVAVSAVQSRDGRILDLTALADAADAAGARTLIDVTQSCPWLAIDARRFDVVVASAYKWLNAPRGIALAAVSPAALGWVRPVGASWYGSDLPWESLYAPEGLADTARRLDTSPPWQLCDAAAVALEAHAAEDPAALHRHGPALADALRAELGLAPTGSAMVSLAAQPCDLAAAGITAASRTGRVRVGFHVHNDEIDVQRAVAALRPAVLAA